VLLLCLRVQHYKQLIVSEAESEFVQGLGGDRKPAPAMDFTTTRWSLVLRVRQTQTPLAADALEQLCRTYWFPIYAYVRRRQNDPETAKDLTQEFFVHLLEQDLVARADPAKGRFRAFVITLLKHFLINQHERRLALKRGAGRTPLSLDAMEAEERYRHEPVQNQAPDTAFDHQWAEEILARALETLKRDYEAAGLGRRFDKLKPFLPRGHDPSSYAETAVQLGISEAATRKAIFMLRRRFADLFRQEIAQTVSSAEEAEAEMRHLLMALA
jgi:RNA polymerase sigma-70 factor (ECF subfamily)